MFLIAFIVVSIGVKKIIQQRDKSQPADDHGLVVDKSNATENNINAHMSIDIFQTPKTAPEQPSNEEKTLSEPLDQQEYKMAKLASPQSISNKYGYTPIENDFFTGLRNAGFKTKKINKFYMDSVFEREPDPNWSKVSEKKLKTMFNKIREKYSYEKNVNSIICSDLMCFVGLNYFPKLETFELRKQIIRDGGFPSYRTIHDPKSAKGIYILRYNQRYLMHGSN